MLAWIVEILNDWYSWEHGFLGHIIDYTLWHAATMLRHNWSIFHYTNDICQGLKSSFIIQATRRPIFHSRFEQKKIVVAQHRPNIRQNPGGEMQKLLRDGSKKHSDPAKASFPVGDSMCACAVWSKLPLPASSVYVWKINNSGCCYYVNKRRNKMAASFVKGFVTRFQIL